MADCVDLIALEWPIVGLLPEATPRIATVANTAVKSQSTKLTFAKSIICLGRPSRTALSMNMLM
jgi:hypothetical protein